MTEAVDAAGAVDAQNAPTAPWKSLRDSHKRPQPFIILGKRKTKASRAHLGKKLRWPASALRGAGEIPQVSMVAWAKQGNEPTLSEPARSSTLRCSGGPRSGPSAATGCYASHESGAPGGHALSAGLDDPLDGR